jgi:hypothetical protein
MLPRCYRLRVGSIPKVPQGVTFKLLSLLTHAKIPPPSRQGGQAVLASRPG